MGELRFGILGAASIAKKNARAIVRAEGCTLVAVASRDLYKAAAWRDELKLREVRAVEGYDALLASADVDAVYIPLPTSLHLEWVVKAAQAGKHVLVEKPVGRNLDEVKQMVQACQQHSVLLLDGTMFVHHARFAAMNRIFADEAFWTPSRVTAAFTFRGDAGFLDGGNIRTRADGDPLGCLGDVGWYCIRLGLAAFRNERPVAVVARMRDASEEGIPFDMDVDVLFSQDGSRLLTFHCSFKHHFRQWFEAYSDSSGRCVRCSDFVIPRREELCEYEIEEIPDQASTIEYDTIVCTTKTSVPVLDCSQEREMWVAFAKLAKLAPADRPTLYTEAILQTHAIIDAALASAKAGGARCELAA